MNYKITEDEIVKGQSHLHLALGISNERRIETSNDVTKEIEKQKSTQTPDFDQLVIAATAKCETKQELFLNAFALGVFLANVTEGNRKKKDEMAELLEKLSRSV